tara:strand:- start:388 stop:528 length:141 start_codon:yes stop_codon:yes gene_type:complete
VELFSGSDVKISLLVFSNSRSILRFAKVERLANIDLIRDLNEYYYE